MGTTTAQLARQVAGTVADLERLIALAEDGAGDVPRVRTANAAWLVDDHGAELAGDPDDDEVEAACAQVLYTWPLEVVEHATRRPGGDWERSHVVVVFATGGPHVELDTKERAVVGYWGGDVVRRSIDERVCRWYEEYGA